MPVSTNASFPHPGRCNAVQHDPLQTSREEVYAVGPFRESKDIRESLLEASGAEADAGAMLCSARGSLTCEAKFPPDIEKRISKITESVVAARAKYSVYFNLESPETSPFLNEVNSNLSK